MDQLPYTEPYNPTPLSICDERVDELGAVHTSAALAIENGAKELAPQVPLVAADCLGDAHEVASQPSISEFPFASPSKSDGGATASIAGTPSKAIEVETEKPQPPSVLAPVLAMPGVRSLGAPKEASKKKAAAAAALVKRRLSKH